MSSLFYYKHNFNADISAWDTSRVTDMNYMFTHADAFNQPLSWDTSSVTDMEKMFYEAKAFNQPLSWDTSSVTDMNSMFREARAFNQPLSWDISRVMFWGAMFWMDGPNSLSAANKLRIYCAWAGNPEFDRVYDKGDFSFPSWAPGSCD